MLTDRHFPVFNVSGFSLAIEKTGGAGVAAPEAGDA